MKRCKIVLLVALIVSIFSGTGAFAVQDIDYEYGYTSDFQALANSTSNGEWSYEYNADVTENEDGTYANYNSYTVMTPDGTRWEGTVGSNTKGRFTSSDIAIYPNGRIAAVWTAPMSGSVEIIPGEGLGRTHSSFDPTKNLQSIFVRIVVKDDTSTQELYKRELLPASECCYSNNPYADDPSISVEVKAGDKIYFEAYGTTNQYNTFRWKMPVKYQRFVQYYNSTQDEIVSNLKDVSAGDTVTCTFFDSEQFTGGHRLWFMIKDSEGRLAESSISSSVTLNGDNRYLETSIVVPDLFDEEDGYEQWTIDVAVTKGASWYPAAAYTAK